MTLVIHHLENSRSQRILWLLEELGLPYEVKRYSRDPKTRRAPPALKAVHPLGKSPAIVDAGHVIAESGAIVEYLVEKADGRLGPPAHREAALRYRHFLHYAEGSLMPPLIVLSAIGRLGVLRHPERKRMLDTHLDWLETELADRSWFAGNDFTAADVMMSYPLEVARQRGDLDASRANLVDWLERIHARPAYGRALERGGPYSLA